MKKVVVHRAGGWERLRLEEHPDPTPGPGEVAIAVEACGVNYADVCVRMGLYASAKEYVGWPITPGFEVAGKVVAVGPGVATPTVGDDVLAVVRFGGYASRVVAPATQVFARPAGWDAPRAAGFPAAFLTAHHALLELAHPRPGSRLLVHSAAGGVGGALLQLARCLGCEATAVVGAEHKVEVARRLGAAHVVDASKEPLWPTLERLVPGGFDVVLDANGASTIRQSWEHLAPTGKLVVYGFASMLSKGRDRPSWLKLAWTWLRTPRFDPLEMTNLNRSVLAFNLSYLFDRADLLKEAMDRLLGWAREGKLVPWDTRTFPLDRVADAHRALESGSTTGKLVLVP
jgi:synaptic vesicle membrane protein VAT-1